MWNYLCLLDYAVVEVECLSDSEEDDYSHSEQQQSGEDLEHKCVMCAKVFKHAENLRIHVQSHLGAKAQLRSCQRCKK